MRRAAGTGAQVMVIFARKCPLKQILLDLITLYTFGNLALAFAPNETAALVLHLIPGLSHGTGFGVARSSWKKWFRPNGSRVPWLS